MAIEVADEGRLGQSSDPDEHFEQQIAERQEGDIFLARARAQAERDHRVCGTLIDEDRIWKEAKRLRKRYEKKIKHLEKAQDIEERERKVERQELEIKAREEAHQRVITRIEEQIEAGRTSSRELNSKDAQAAISAILDDRLSDLIKLRSEAHSNGMAKAMLLGLQAFPIAIFVSILQIFLPDSIKPWVLMPLFVVVALLGLKMMRTISKDLGITTLKGEDKNVSTDH